MCKHCNWHRDGAALMRNAPVVRRTPDELASIPICDVAQKLYDMQADTLGVDTTLTGLLPDIGTANDTIMSDLEREFARQFAK